MVYINNRKNLEPEFWMHLYVLAYVIMTAVPSSARSRSAHLMDIAAGSNLTQNLKTVHAGISVRFRTGPMISPSGQGPPVTEWLTKGGTGPAISGAFIGSEKVHVCSAFVCLDHKLH